MIEGGRIRLPALPAAGHAPQAATPPPRDPALLLPTPAPDPWLVPPTGFEDAHPGTVLRSRPVQVGPLLTPNTASQLMVRSTDSKGRPVPVAHHRDRPDRAVERAGAASGGRLQHRDRLAWAHLRAVVDPAEGHRDRDRRDRGDARQELRGGRDRSSGPAAGVRRRTDVRTRRSRFAAGGDPQLGGGRCAGVADRPLRVLRWGDRGRLGCRVGAFLRP